MTCIAAITDGVRVVMGADSASTGSSSGWSLTIRADEKVFRRGPYLIGFTTSFRMGQILRYDAILPDPCGDDLMAFMVQSFIPAIRHALKDGGQAQVKDNVEEGGAFLVAFGGHLFGIGPDFQVTRARLPFDAVGCGAEIAIGALYALTARDVKDSLEQIVREALQAAQGASAGVRGPFVILST